MRPPPPPHPGAKTATPEATGSLSDPSGRRRSRSFGNARSGDASRPETSTPASAFKGAGSASAPASTADTGKPATVALAKKTGKLRFQFRYQPWKDVLDWFATQADLSLVIPGTSPDGTFNYSDSREYTPAEAIDLLNSVLSTKNFALIRRDRMLLLVPADEAISTTLAPTVTVEALASKGESEFVNVLFPLHKYQPAELESEVQKLLGAHGTVKSLPKSQQLSVTDTVARQRAVRDYLKHIEDDVIESSLKIFQLKNAQAEDVLPILKQLLEVPEDKTASSDGSVRVALEGGSGRLLVSGHADKVARAAEIIRKLDAGPVGEEGLGFPYRWSATGGLPLGQLRWGRRPGGHQPAHDRPDRRAGFRRFEVQ